MSLRLGSMTDTQSRHGTPSLFLNGTSSEYFDLHQPERNAIDQLLRERKEVIEREDASVTGFNVGVNCGQDAGQTIWHAHVHLIPRRNGDVVNPRGGVRGCIPAQQNY